MKIKAILMLFFFIFSLSMPALAENRARICITRDALNDISDKFPVHITIDKKDIFQLLGGAKKCILFQKPGKFVFTAYSPNFDDLNNMGYGVTHSEALEVNILEGEEITLKVEPLPFSTQFPEFWKISLSP